MQPADSVSLSLSSPRRTIWRAILLLAGAGAAVVVGVIVFGLVTSQPGGAACDQLESIRAERAVKKLERFVSSSVVRMKLVDGTERVEVSGCPAAMSTLAKTMSHKQFTKLTACLESATTDAQATRCL